MESVLATKMPKISNFNQSLFMNMGLMYDRSIRNLCAEFGKHVMAKCTSTEHQSMLSQISTTVVQMTEDQSFMKFKNYSQNAMVLMNVTENINSKAKLDNLVDIAKNSLVELTLSKMKMHIEKVKEQFDNYIKNMFEEIIKFSLNHKTNIINIINEIDSIFLKSNLAPSPSKASCNCLKPDAKCLQCFCYANGVKEEVKEGLKLSFSCPTCNKYVNHVFTNITPFKEHYPLEFKQIMEELNSMMSIYTSPCKNCNHYTSSWEKVSLKCGMTYCVNCFKSCCRKLVNDAVIANPSPKCFMICQCKNQIDDDITKIIMKDEIDSIHRVMKINNDKRMKGVPKTYTLLCVSCGKEKEMSISTASSGFKCC